MYKFQIASDLHIDINHPQKFSSILEPSAPYLILAGDIAEAISSDYRNFLKYCDDNWELVFLVAGNHEYYQGSIERTDQKLKLFENDFDNLHILQRDKYLMEDEKIRILGTTLWSYIPPKAQKSVYSFLNDYQMIDYLNHKTISIGDTNQLFYMNYRWLSEELKKDEEYQTIVVTHHAPTFKNTSAPIYRDQMTNYAFANSLDNLFPGVDLWIHGHTHYNHCDQYGKTMVVANQYGYELECPDYRKDMVVEVKKFE